MNETKSRILYILKYLWQNTDSEHYTTTADIIAYLKENGISCDRKTIPNDIAKLCNLGIDIEEERSRENHYSLSSHLFTLPEVKLLIDAVESSKFITAKKSTELVDKLSKMTSNYQSEELKRNIYISERVKPLNEQIYYLVDNINTAINKGKQIETETDKVPLNHMSSHIMGRVVKYQYLQGEGNAVNGHTEYVLEFEPLYSESNIELYIELKSGEKISIPLDLKCVD